MLPKLTYRLRSAHRRQGGQVLWFVAALVAVLGGMVALAIDIGSYMTDRRDLQNDADAIALAASQELPNGAAAQTAADSWAAKNGVRPGQMSIQIIAQNPPSEPNPKVRVNLTRSHGFTFARLVGISSANVETVAAAIKTSPAGGENIIPLSVTEPALAGVGLSDQVVLKYDSNNIETGNTGPIQIDGPGAGNCTTVNNYCYGLMYGSETVLCTDGADPTYCSGPTSAQTQPGNQIGATRDAISCRLYDTTEAFWPGNNVCGTVYTDDECDTFSEVFIDDPTTAEPGVYSFSPGCNPFVNATYASNRVVIIPVINQLCNGACTVTIVDFALFFLEGFGDGTGNGNPQQECFGTECEIIGTLIRVDSNVGLLAGTYDASSNNQFVRLVE